MTKKKYVRDIKAKVKQSPNAINFADLRTDKPTALNYSTIFLVRRLLTVVILVLDKGENA